MQDIIINQNTYRVRREFSGKMELMDVIVESVRNTAAKKMQLLTAEKPGGIIDSGSVRVQEGP